MGIVFGLVSPTAAFAAPPAEDIEGLPVPEAVPEWVWRADTRGPADGIFDDGFRPKGDEGSWNDNLADHVLNTEQPNRSAWVSTSYDQDEALSFGRSNLDGPFWEYQIAPDETFTSVQISFKDALLPGGEYDEDLANRFEKAKDSWFGDVEGEAEFSAFGGIDGSNVHSARKWEMNDDGDWEVTETAENPTFSRPVTQPNLDPHPIPESGVCYGGARATCAPSIGDEGDLADVHGDRFSGDTDDFDFTLRTDELAEDESLLLAPAPDSVAIVDDFAADVHDAGAFDEFTDEITSAFEADADALAEVSSASSVIDSVAESMEVVLDTGSELLPYFGIAATGYALKGDIEHGDWGDAAADGIAEAIQTAMVVAPEFDIILVPLLWVDLLAKAIGDWAYSLFHPAPEYSEAYRNQLEKANDQVDAAPGLLTDAWTKERDAVLVKFSNEQIEQRLVASVTEKIRSDITVLREMDRAVLKEIVRHEARAIAHARNDGERQSVRLSSLRAQADLRATTQHAVDERVEQYRARYAGLIDATAAATWKLSLEKLAGTFVEDQKVSEYLTKVSEIASEAYFQKPFDQLPPGEKEIARDRGAEERAALHALVPEIERSRHWTGPNGADRTDMIGLLRTGVERGIKDDLKLPPARTATTLGVHGLRVTPTDGSPWAAGATGTVRWDRQTGSSAIPVDGPVGTSFSWTVELPTGLTAGTLPSMPAVPGWTQTWKQDGQTLVHTATRTSGSGPAFGERQQYAVPVTATAALRTSDAVRVTFAPPRGHTSTAALGFATIAVANFEPIEHERVDSSQGGHLIRFGAQSLVPVTTTWTVKLEAKTPEGVWFDDRPVLHGAMRDSAEAAWYNRSDLSVTTNSVGYRSVKILTWKGFSVEPGVGVSWATNVTVLDRAAGKTFEIPYTLTLEGDGVSTTMHSAIKFGPSSVFKQSSTGSTQLEAGASVAVPIDVQAVGSSVASLGAGSLTLRAPEGTVFDPTETLSATKHNGTPVPNAAVSGIRSGDGGKTMTGTIRGGSISLAEGDRLRWLAKVRLLEAPSDPWRPGLAFELSGTSSAGPVSVDGFAPVSYPQDATRVTFLQHHVPTIEPGESGSVLYSIKSTRRVDGVGLVLRAPSSTTFADSSIGWEDSSSTVMPGVLSADAKTLTVALTKPVPSGANSANVYVPIAVDPNVSSRPDGGTADVTGPVESTRTSIRVDTTLVPVVPEPSPGALSITSSAIVGIRQGESGHQQFRVQNVGDEASRAFRLTATVPEGSLPTSAPLMVRQGSSQTWTAVPADVSGRNVTARSDLPALSAGGSIDVRLFLRNTESDWSTGTRTGGVLRASSGTETLAESPFLFIALLGDGKMLAQCTASAGLAQVRMRWSEESNGYYKVTVEQARVTSSFDYLSPNAQISLQLKTDGYEGAWATESVRRGDWASGGPTAWAFIRKPKLIVGRLDVDFTDHPLETTPNCHADFTIFKN
ncbi:hypothetical protein [Curtobacterium sp. YR515]|uniref:hypothetical protein n=1 Tax=Curtobacterium sp. YR515 TaxID=1855316 RepID=UPI0008E74F60|nr:hypothetical protein [Curtobacterium sp. YR515]SFF86721.1 hypothetical protein SAMN05216329_3001 [Curtobacterium sp. YR515]